MLNVLFDTSPLKSGHAGRGIGMYTKWLKNELEKSSLVQVFGDPKEVPKGTKIDVIHYPFFDIFFPTLPLFRKYPTVVTIHDVIPLRFPAQYKSGKRGKIHFLRQRLALHKVAAVLTDSEASKADIVKYLKVPVSKVHVAYLAANPDLQKVREPVVAKVREKYHLPKRYVLYVGDINYNKNIPQLIKSLKFLPDDVSLVCIGKNFRTQDIPEWHWIETQIALSDVANRVHFVTELGNEANDELAALYSGALCYVQPSLYEGFGLPVLEAMQCKTPVVCTKNSSLLEVGGEHVQYVETDAESIAEGIKILLDMSQNKRDEFVRSAHTWAAQFTWRKTARATISVYEQVQRTDEKKS